ncbi:hypothetical protein YC2023_114241 [Brassica napus]
MTKVDNKDNSVCVWFLKFSDADELKRQLIMVDRQPEDCRVKCFVKMHDAH